MSNKGNVAILGHFGGNEDFLDGQTVKTKVIYSEINQDFITYKIDTYKWKSRGILIFFKLILCLNKCDSLIILLSQNGMKVFFPLIYILNKIFRKDIFHVVIGGNLDELIKQHNSWMKYIKSFNINYVETNSMKLNLEKQGITNVKVMPNFKRIEVLKEEELKKEYDTPYRLCTFSRVTKEKGILEAINAVNEINIKYGKIKCCLDIYGPIDESFKEQFHNTIQSYSEFVQYKGKVNYNESVNILKDYYLLLFPTYFFGEGFPGTVIDSFSAGVPVIASDWHSNKEIIVDGYSGYIYSLNDKNGLTEKIENAINNDKVIYKMKKNCISEAEKYRADIVIKDLSDNLIRK